MSDRPKIEKDVEAFRALSYLVGRGYTPQEVKEAMTKAWDRHAKVTESPNLTITVTVREDALAAARERVAKRGRG